MKYKYGIGVDNRTRKPVNNTVKKFNEDHWNNLMKMPNSCWIPFPKEKVFISFNEFDRSRMKILKKRLNTSELVKPIIVEDKREGSKLLAELVTNSINESNFFIAILSEISMNTQWVNQEIGYAMNKSNLEIIPITQTSTISKLKGWTSSRH